MVIALCPRERPGGAAVGVPFAAGETLFHDLVESAPDAMVVVNTAGIIVLVNTRTERMFGYRRQDLLGQPIEILVPERFRSRHAGHRRGYGAKPWVREMGGGRDLYGRRKNGDEFPVEIGLSPIYTDDGMLVSNAIRDVTARKRAERARLDKRLERAQASEAVERARILAQGAIERQQREAALGHERDRAQRYLDTADVILLALDLEGRITLINRKGCELLGASEAELLGLPWIETSLPARMQDTIRAALQRVLDGDLAVVENPVVTRAGAERLIEWRNTILRNDAGRTIGTLSSGTDITDRRQAEQAQRASEARYRTLFEYAPDGILIADRGGRYIDVNASLCRMLGYTRDQLIGLTGADVVAETEIPHIGPALHAITTTSDYHREWQFRRSDGSVFPADVISTVMPDGNLLAVIRDVSERNQTIEALRVTEERMRIALESANVGIWDMDYTTGALRWSAIIEGHYGLPPGTFGGTFDTFLSRIHPDDRAAVLETVGNAAQAGGDFSVEHRTLWLDGTVRWLCGAGRVVLGEHGEPVRAVGISQDITGRKHAESEFARLNDDIQRQRLRVFKATMRTVQDIVNNLLNGLQLEHLEGESETSVATHARVDQAIRAAAAKLRMLGNLETIREKDMVIGPGIDYPGA